MVIFALKENPMCRATMFFFLVFMSSLQLSSTSSFGGEAEGKPFFFHDGDRIVVVGNSITVQGFYVRYLETFIRTRYPTWTIFVRNSAINGHTAKACLKYMDADVLAWKPTVVIISYHGSWRDFPQDAGSIGDYEEGTTPYVDKLLDNKVRAVLCSHTPFDLGDPPGIYTGANKDFDVMANFGKEFAGQRHIPFVDQFHFCHDLFGRNLRREKPVAVTDQTLVKFPSDHVHIRGPGQLPMAYNILKTLHAPAEVSYASIDAVTGKAETRRCAIRDFQALPDGKGISFVRADEASPCWIDDKGAPGLELVPFQAELNRMILRVTGLRAGQYKLEVEGFSQGIFTDQQLAEGVNLSENRLSPLSAPGREVAKRIQDCNILVQKMRNAVTLFSLPDWLSIPDLNKQKQAELERRFSAIQQADASIGQAAKPKPLHYTVVASGPTFREMKIEGNKARLFFNCFGSGLMAAKRSERSPVAEAKDGKLERFAISGADKIWQWAEAIIEGETVVVSSPRVKEPVAVRYAFWNPEGANLYNRDGLPLAPFRTDNFPPSTIEKWKFSDVQSIRLREACCPDPADDRLQWWDIRCLGNGFVDAHNRIGERPGVVYFVTDVDVGPYDRGNLYLGYDGPVIVWLNGKKYFEGPGDNPAEPDKTTIGVDLKHGQNRLAIALDTHEGKAWGIFARYEQTQY